MATIMFKDILNDEAARFAHYLHAFKECSPEVQRIAEDMAAIIVNPASEDEDREHARDTLVEAIFPNLIADVVECHQGLMRSESALQTRMKLVEEESIFSERVRALMNERGMTQEDLAQLTGVGQSAIANMLARCCRPQRRTVERFAEAFGVSPEDLWPGFTGEEIRTPTAG